MPKIHIEYLFTVINQGGLFMNQDYFASVTADQLRMVMSEKLFSSVLNVMGCGVQLLRSVYDDNENVVDFEIIYSNKTGSLYRGKEENKRLLSHNGDGNDEFYSKIIKALSDGKPQQHIKAGDVFTVSKLIDGALVTNEKCDERSLSPLKDLLEIKDLNRSNEIMNIALKSAGGGLGYWEAVTGKIIWDKKGIELMGLPEAEAYTVAECFNYIHTEDKERVEEYMKESAREGKEILLEFRVLHGAEIKHLLATGLFKKDDAGKPLESYVLLMDLTHAKISEEKIRELNKSLSMQNHVLESANSEIRTFNSIAATDYKETLQKLYTNLEFILTKEAKNLTDAGKGNLRKIQSSIQKLKLLTDDIVSFSSIHTQDESPVDVDLNDLLKNLLQELDSKIKEAGATIEADQLPHISGFPLLLAILFQHLLDNALKFKTPDRSPVIRIRYTQVNGLVDAAETNNLPYHKISFIDNGIGFDKEESDKLFAMFYRLHDKSKYKGSGIGLAISKKIMDLHRGFIRAESAENKTVFSCYFPAEKL